MAIGSLITRRSFVQAGGIAAASLALRPALAVPAPRSLSFVAVGDWGHASAKARAVASAMGERAAAIGSDFVISLGDNFYPRGVENVNDRQWTETFEKAFTAPSLKTPWNVVAGNHDHVGNAFAQIEYSRVSKRWRMPALYYKRTETLAKNVKADFFYLDTESMREENSLRPRRRFIVPNAAEQLTWLENELATSRATWKIVIGHHPVYSGGSHGDTKRLVNWLPPLFKKYGVQAYLAGHNHNLEHIVVDDIHYLVSGGGASPEPLKLLASTRFGISGLGFITGQLTPEAMYVEFVNQDALSLYRTAIPLGV